MEANNAAAMREALVAALPIMRNCPFTHYNTTDVDAVVAMMEQALSAPARNCDLYSNANEALKAHEEAFEESNFQHGECRLGCPGCDDGLIDCKILWLFAPAAERK